MSRKEWLAVVVVIVVVVAVAAVVVVVVVVAVAPIHTEYRIMKRIFCFTPSSLFTFCSSMTQ